MTQLPSLSGSRPDSRNLPPIRSVVPFPPEHVSSHPSPGSTIPSQQALAVAYPDGSRMRQPLAGHIGQAGRGALSIRPAPYAASLSSSIAAMYDVSPASSTASPTVSESGSQLYTPLSSQHSSPEFKASVPAKRGSQDSRSSGRARKRGSSDDNQCPTPSCTAGKECQRCQKIRKEKKSRRDHQINSENVEDFVEFDLDHRSSKVQTAGNRTTSGLERDKQQNDNACYSVVSRSTLWIKINCGPETHSKYIQDMRRGIAEDEEQRQAGRALPLGDPMAGPRGDADICPNVDDEGNCTCADKITCRKQRRYKGYTEFHAQLAHERRAAAADHASSSSRTPTNSRSSTSSRTPASNSSSSRSKGKL